MQDSIIYIHTTTTIIDYVNLLSDRYLEGINKYHIVDETILYDIRNNNVASAKRKLENIITGAKESGATRFLITCTSTGQIVDGLDKNLNSNISRIEDASMDVIKKKQVKVGIVYTNPTVWPEMEASLKRYEIGFELYTPLHIDKAFDALLSGDILMHDQLVYDFIESHVDDFELLLLSQVSVCNTLERKQGIKSSEKIISMADLGIKALDRRIYND